MRIALIRCPWVTISTYPPDIGFAYIATILKEEGHEVSIFDLNIEFYHKIEDSDREKLDCCNIEILLDFGQGTSLKYASIFNDMVNRILKVQPEIIGFCVWETNKLISLELAKRVKEIAPSIFTIFGGPDCYPLFSGREFAEESAVDLVTYGEAELTIIKVLDSIKRNKKVLSTPGVIIRIDGKVIDCGWSEVVEDLDKLPFLALDDFPLELYGYSQKALPISFNRGCVYRCEYCPREMYPKFRSRSPEDIVQEIKYLKEKFTIKNFLVCDSSITSNLVQISKLCDLVLMESLEVSLGGFASTHPGLDYKLLRKMKRAGFGSFVYGVESGSEKILSRFGKKIGLKTIERVIRDTYKAGIEVGVDMLVGLPGESEDDFNHSIEFLIRNRNYIRKIGVNSFGLKPYSYMFSYVEKYDFVAEQLKMERVIRLKEVIASLSLSETVKCYAQGETVDFSK